MATETNKNRFVDGQIRQHMYIRREGNIIIIIIVNTPPVQSNLKN